MNRKLLVFLGLVAALVVFAGALKTAPFATAAYQEAAQPPSPPAQSDSVAGEKLDAQNKATVATKPYEPAEYRRFPVVGSRVAIWVVAQLHLLFAAFVLAVPIFALIVEAIGYKTGDKRYDRLAYEFTKLLSVSFSLTATFGAALTFMLIILYPKFTNYLMSVFSPTFLPYVGLFFFEAFFLYTYYYGWGKFHPLVHLGLGLGLNVVGTGIMLIANSWLTFMMSPRGVAADGAVISVWEAVSNFTWMPINVHRVIANVAFGGSIAAAYAAFKFLQATTDEERAHYDWMGYIGNFVAISAFLPLPFAGYWLAKEIYAYSQTLGLTMMGGAFSWLFIIQAVLIGNLFLAANYYLWLGMGRVEGRQPIQKVIKYLLITIAVCFMVWATPRSIIATVSEIRSMGGSSHPILGFLGVMSAKNTAVNILILTTFMSFLLYRRTGKVATVAWAKKGHAAQLAIFAVVAVFVIFLGVYGYFVEATVRIGLSVPQVLSVLLAMVAITAIDIFLFRGAQMTADVRWGRIPAISQYVLIFIAVTFTWLMGLMGYVRSGLRQHWHVYGVIRDQSADAFTPTLGFATQVVSGTVLVFFVLIGFVFWLASLHDRPEYEERVGARESSGPSTGSGPSRASSRDGKVPPELAAEHSGRA
jgi:cytochrome bd-type quinol oxidase subunit 1